MVWLLASMVAGVHLVAVDPFGRPVEEATWTLEDGVIADQMGDGTVDLPPGHYRVAVTAPGFFGQNLEFDVVAGHDSEVQAVLDASLVTLTDRAIVIHDKVYFETNLAVIKPESHELLRQVARVMVEHPELLEIRVEGHADERGGDDFNLDLSHRRAQAVRQFLIAQGVSPSRLVAKGFGESQPVAEGHDEAAWEQNRRVEFIITERLDLSER